MLNRTEVIQRIIDTISAYCYLEIGIYQGSNFLKIRVPFKMAVDPEFKIPWKRRWKWTLLNPSNFRAQYYAMTSDVYFQKRSNEPRPDVVFIDGLHTYKQVIKDLRNSLSILNEGGVIVLHDCNPTSDISAQPAESLSALKAANPPSWSGEWSGDVWKAICHLRSERPDLDICVLDCDHGLGLIVRRPATERLNLDLTQIETMTYADLERDRDQLLNLRPITYFNDFLATIGKDRPAFPHS